MINRCECEFDYYYYYYCYYYYLFRWSVERLQGHMTILTHSLLRLTS